jgi:ribonuclease P protein component
VLARANRVTSPDDFRLIMRRGRRIGGDLTVVHFLRIEGQPVRFGFVVGRAVGNAVTRNQVRRRLRAIARELLPTIADGSSVVVRALPPAADGSASSLSADLTRSLERTGVVQ